MRLKWFFIGGLSLIVAACALARGFFDNDEPLRFSAKGEMLFPEHYREWAWLSSGLGMSYTPGAQENSNPNFDNVFVSPAAHRAFLSTGTWPNGTVFMLEIRASRNRGSINQAGRFQGDLKDVEAHVKKPDGQWAFYSFGEGRKPAFAIPHHADCYSCHEQHGAVDTTFVQFYPTLLKVAREKKTFKDDGQ